MKKLQSNAAKQIEADRRTPAAVPPQGHSSAVKSGARPDTFSHAAGAPVDFEHGKQHSRTDNAFR
jgi:hypothetical protein